MEPANSKSDLELDAVGDRGLSKEEVRDRGLDPKDKLFRENRARRVQNLEVAAKQMLSMESSMVARMVIPVLQDIAPQWRLDMGGRWYSSQDLWAELRAYVFENGGLSKTTRDMVLSLRPITNAPQVTYMALILKMAALRWAIDELDKITATDKLRLETGLGNPEDQKE